MESEHQYEALTQVIILLAGVFLTQGHLQVECSDVYQ